MKHCPKCKREYEDDSLRFCLDDGTQLAGPEVSPTIAGPTMVLPASEPSPATISRVARPNVPPPDAPDADEDRVEPTQQAVSPGPPSARTVRIIIGVLFVISLIANIIGWAAWGFITVRRLPLTLLFLIVMLLALVRAPRHPKVSLLVGLALGFDLIVTFIYRIIDRSLIPLQTSTKISDAAMQTIYTVLAVLDDFALAAVLILFTTAVLTGRKQPAVV